MALPRPDHTIEEMLTNVFDLEKITENAMRARPGHIYGMFGEGQRLFGGQTVAQSYVTAKSLARGRHIHSLHMNFLSAVDPIEYQWEEMDDSLQRVTAQQRGKTSRNDDLYREEEPEHLSDVGHVECYPDAVHIMNGVAVHDLSCGLAFHLNIEVHDGNETALLFTDFYALAAPAEVARAAGFDVKAGASINHHVYFHRKNVDPFQWFLYSMEFIACSFDRPHLRIHVCDEEKRLVFTAHQEAFMVSRRFKPPTSKL